MLFFLYPLSPLPALLLLESKLFPWAMTAAGTLTGLCVSVRKKKERTKELPKSDELMLDAAVVSRRYR